MHLRQLQPLIHQALEQVRKSIREVVVLLDAKVEHLAE